MIDVESHDPTRDKPLRKSYELDNNVIYTEPKDPHGFWWIHFEKGQLPESLRGAYTTMYQADRAIQTYLAEKKRKIKEA